MAKRYSIAVIFGFVPLLCVLAGLFLKWVTEHPHLGVVLPDKSSMDAALKMSSVSTLPCLALVIVVGQVRMTTGHLDPLKVSTSILLDRLRAALQNTVEQTVLFVFSLFAANATNTLTTQHLTLATILFIGVRAFYVATYLLGEWLQFPPVRALAFLISYFGSGFLLCVGLKFVYARIWLIVTPH